jgi:hypothetical protein
MNKLSRQDVFEKVWNHYVVEGNPYAVDDVFKGTKSVHPVPSALATRNELSNHVTKTFIRDLDKCHDSSVNFAFSTANFMRIKNLYARRFQRLFRRTMKFYLINFAMTYGLTVDSDIARTVHARKLARKNKK